MDAVRQQLNRPLVVGIVAFVAGLIIGLVVLGWWLFPVQWTDASPAQLRPDLQQDYMRMAIDSYSVNKDAALAISRYESLGTNAPSVLSEVAANPGAQSPASILAFQAAVQGAAAPAPGTAAPGALATATPVGAATTAPTLMRVVLPILCVIVLLLAAGLVALFFLRSRGGAARPVPAARTAPATRTAPPVGQPQQVGSESEWTDYSSLGEETPMVQFMASYKLGDDLFDDSFSIDSPSGEFLGECGVGISETIGVGEPKKVTAFEVWLFDKNDIQTVTKVLMSAHAFMDETTRQRLVAKGEPVLIEPGTETILETQSLRLVVRVVDTGYGEGALPAQSFFDRLILELAVWQKG
jgi:hypothetical protein